MNDYLYEDLPMHEPRFSWHDSGMAVKHDFPCCVCRISKAVYRIDIDVFMPCDACRSEGWVLRQPSRWVPRWIRRAMTGGAR